MADPGGGGASIAALEQLYRTRYSRFLRVAVANVGSRIVTNVALTARGAATVTEAHELDDIPAPTNGTAPMLPELRAAIALLPERQRQALFLRHYADLSYEEIGEVLGIARGTVSATLHAARNALRVVIPEEQR